MADYYTDCVMKPNIPAHLINDEQMKIIEAFLDGEIVSKDESGKPKLYYFRKESYSGSGVVENEDGTEEELDEDDLTEVLEEIVSNSNGELTHITLEAACHCNMMRPDGFGGWAVFVSPGSIEWMGTGNWLSQKEAALKEALREAA